MKVLLVYQECAGDEPILLGVFTDVEQAERCEIAGQTVGLDRYTEVYFTSEVYDPVQDYLFQEELETSNTRCVGYDERGFIYEDIESDVLVLPKDHRWASELFGTTSLSDDFPVRVYKE